MKVPPLIINLKNIEKHDHKHDKDHKKHKKHKKHKHKHHHHRDKQSSIVTKILNPPVLEPVDLPEPYLEDNLHIVLPPQHEEPVAIVEPPSVVESSDITSVPNSNEVPEQENNDVAEATETTAEPAETAVEVPEQEQQPIADNVEVSDIVPKKAPEPNSQLSFLKLAEDGGVRLSILGPIKQPEESNEKILNLEQICGQLQDGLDVIPSDINEEECIDQLQVNPVGCVETPAFGSYLPMKDSTFANLTKEDSETLLEIYGGNATTLEYAESLQNYASGTNYLMKMVDSLLDLLTEGKHNKEAVPIRQKASITTTTPAAIEPAPKTTDGNGEDENINDQESDEVQKQLNEIDTLLAELRKMQEQRLSSSPAPIDPDEAETKLAEEILQKMTKLIKEKSKPSEICDSSSILKALGIPLDVQL